MFAASYYEGLVAAVLALLGLAMFLLLGTLLNHMRITLRLRRQRQRRATLLPLVCRALGDREARETLLAECQPRDRDVLLPILLQLALDLRGEDAVAIAAFAEELDVAEGERRRLHARRAVIRAEAVKNLGLLRSARDLPALLRAARNDPSPEVRAAAAGALGQIGGPGAVMGLLQLLDDEEAGVVRRAQAVVLHAAPDAVRAIVRHARSTPSPSAKRAAVELLGALRDPEASELLVDLVDDPDPELRTKAVKSASAIGDPRFLEAFLRLLGDPAWSVRCQAATGLGAIGAVRAIPELREALDDPAWWVRFNAASALAELGAPGLAALAEATTLPERRASEVARYVLDRTGLEPLAA